MVAGLGKSYPGRAGASAISDLFVTLLEMGADGFRRLLDEREAMVPGFRDALGALADKYGERLLDTLAGNTISHGITLNTFKNPTMIGSMLYEQAKGERIGARVWGTGAKGPTAAKGYGRGISPLSPPRVCASARARSSLAPARSLAPLI